MSTDRQPGSVGILRHYLRYLGANALVVVAGFVSFPVMTRLLDKHQFGLLGYFEAWLLLASGVLKLGAQHAIVRHYPHFKPDALSAFRTNFVLIPYGFTILLWLAIALVLMTMVLPGFPENERRIAIIVLITVPLLIWSSLVESVMYALERSDITLRLKAIWRWSELGLVLVTLTWIERSAAGVFSARLLIVALVAIWLFTWFRRWLAAPFVRPQKSRVVAGLAFGLPMMFSELTMVLFGIADRIILRWLTGDFSQVGIYTIGYGLAMALGTMLGVTLNQTFTPTAIRLYEEEGPNAVVKLKKRILGTWLPVVTVITVWLACVGQEALIVLAGVKMEESAPVFVAIAVTLVWQSLFGIAHYGLLLERRAVRHFLVTLSVTIVNVVLNVPLILAFGVLGAVTATVVSYAIMAVAHLQQCPSRLRYLPPIRFLVGSALLVLPIRMFFEFIAKLLALGLLGRVTLATTIAAILAVLMAVLIPGIRQNLILWLNEHRSRHTASDRN